VLDELSLAENKAPSDPEVFYLRGRAYLAMNRNDEAVAALRRAIELAPMDPGPYYQLGRLYEKLGNTELSKELLTRMQFLKSKPSR
jgi:Flp pilus assembly protein TadD